MIRLRPILFPAFVAVLALCSPDVRMTTAATTIRRPRTTMMAIITTTTIPTSLTKDFRLSRYDGGNA